MTTEKPGEVDCPLCDGGRGWSPHGACRVCNDASRVSHEVAEQARAQGDVWKASTL